MNRPGARKAGEEHLRELEELADTAGAIVVGEMSQQLERPHAGTYLGSGKIDELRDLVAGTSATLVIFDDELSPSQGKNIEDTGARIRMLLSLDPQPQKTNFAAMPVVLLPTSRKARDMGHPLFLLCTKGGLRRPRVYHLR